MLNWGRGPASTLLRRTQRWRRGESRGASIQNEFCGPHKVMRSQKLCDVADVSKGAACSKMATAKLGWAGEIVLMQSPNFMRST